MAFSIILSVLYLSPLLLPVKKNSLFSQWCLEKWISMCKSVSYPILDTKVNSEWIKTLSVRPETSKL